MARMYFIITVEETKQLVRMLEKEYISSEFFPLVKVMLQRANIFLTEYNELPERVNGVDG